MCVKVTLSYLCLILLPTYVWAVVLYYYSMTDRFETRVNHRLSSNVNHCYVLDYGYVIRSYNDPAYLTLLVWAPHMHL